MAQLLLKDMKHSGNADLPGLAANPVFHLAFIKRITTRRFSMSINMKEKIDIYLSKPERFQLDLNNQQTIWMDNVVRPLGSHYEAALKHIRSAYDEAKKNKAEHQKHLDAIANRNALVLSVLLVAVDIVAAGAMKNVVLLSRFQKTKGFDHFLTKHGDPTKAITAFLSQSSSVSDAIIANLDDKIKGLVQTGTVPSAVKTIQSLSVKIDKATSAQPGASWPGAQQFQNQQATFYSSTCRAINESFVKHVRDSDADQTTKRKFIEFYVSIPFVRPPTLSLKSFYSSFQNFYETLYWCEAIKNKVNQRPPPQAKRKFGDFHVTTDGFLADVINARVVAASGHYFTMTGGRKAGSVQKGKDGKVLRVDGKDLRMQWDGFVTKTHADYAETIVKDAKKMIDPIFISQGISCHLTG